MSLIDKKDKVRSKSNYTFTCGECGEGFDEKRFHQFQWNFCSIKCMKGKCEAIYMEKDESEKERARKNRPVQNFGNGGSVC